jgi:hypothetical protein
MLLETLDRVKRRWLSEQIILAAPPHGGELEERLRNLGVEPTDEIRNVFLVLTGFAEEDLDSECFTFWTLDRIAREHSRGWIKDKTYIHFADFLLDSHTYSFKVAGDDPASVYCHWDKDYIVKVSDSFETFFEYYLTDIKKLFPD